MAEPSLNTAQALALSTEQKRDLTHRLARVEGQLRGIQRLVANVEAPEDCDAVAQQMAAARKALDRAFVTMLTSTMITQTTNVSDTQLSAERVQRLAAMLNKFA